MSETATKLCIYLMDQNGPHDHFGQNGLIPNWILAFASPKWTKMVHFGPFWPEEDHFGPFRSANRTLATPDYILMLTYRSLSILCACLLPETCFEVSTGVEWSRHLAWLTSASSLQRMSLSSSPSCTPRSLRGHSPGHHSPAR